jgi:hypothetical protein
MEKAVSKGIASFYLPDIISCFSTIIIYLPRLFNDE